MINLDVDEGVEELKCELLGEIVEEKDEGDEGGGGGGGWWMITDVGFCS